MARSDRQKLFIRAYVNCLNGAEAARIAGYKGKNVRITASKILAKPGVRKEVDRLLAKKSLMSEEEIISRLERQATADISMFLKEGSLDIDPVKVHENGDLVEGFMVTEEGMRLRLYSAQKALELLGKSKALFVERTLTDSLKGMDIVDDGA